MIFGNKTKSIPPGSGSGTWFAPRIYLVQTPHYSAEKLQLREETGLLFGVSGAQSVLAGLAD